MRLHHFFIIEPIEGKEQLTLTDENLIHQLKQVFRYRAGDQLVLLDNSSFQYQAEIVLLTKEEVQVKILSQEKNPIEQKIKVTLYMSLIKKDKFEWVLEKATELGVTTIVPIISERTEKKELHEERALKIIREATEQSGRGILPTLESVMTFDEALAKVQKSETPAIAFDLGKVPFKREEFAQAQNISIFIGPEGGWSEKEVKGFEQVGVAVRSIGQATLRAETAAVAGLSLLCL